MKHEEGLVKKLWVYNELTGALSRKKLFYKSNAMEGWYQDQGFRGYDPDLVDEDRQALSLKILYRLNRDISQKLVEVNRLMNNVTKLTNGIDKS